MDHRPQSGPGSVVCMYVALGNVMYIHERGELEGKTLLQVMPPVVELGNNSLSQ